MGVTSDRTFMVVWYLFYLTQVLNWSLAAL